MASGRRAARAVGRAAAAAGLGLVLFSWSLVGIYEEREWRDRYVFLKHRSSLKVVFRAPLGEADRSSIPGHEGYLTPEQEREERAYAEFVEEHGGWRRSIRLPW